MSDTKATATIKNVKISPKKVSPVMDLVRGKNLLAAKITLAFDHTKAAKLILKALRSAEANAKNTKSLDIKKLRVTNIQVSGGKMMKSGNFVGKGRFNPILKRTSHLYISLEEAQK